VLTIGVLALQGAVAEHLRAIHQLGAKGIEVKKVEQLHDIDGLIIPGGESTTIGKLMHRYQFDVAIKKFSDQGKPIFGTCAGLILMANEITGEKPHLQLMDITVQRNAFGRQRESFETDLMIEGIEQPIRAVFIRAPIIKHIGTDVEVLGTFHEEVIAARQKHLLVSSFHPELANDDQFHKFFIDMVKKTKKN
jgi:5'-phosphate synthase pdxT subunit